MAKIRIVGLVNGEPTPFDGQWVLDYDPLREGVDPNGEPMLCHLVTTPDAEKALDLPLADALALWKKSRGIRPDGKSDSPLTAFSVDITQ